MGFGTDGRDSGYQAGSCRFLVKENCPEEGPAIRHWTMIEYNIQHAGAGDYHLILMASFERTNPADKAAIKRDP